MAAALGAAYTLDGRITDAVPLLTQALEQTMARETVGFQTLCRLPLGEAQMLAGHLEEAHTLAEHTLALARERQERGHQAYALRLLGEIAVRRDPPEDRAGRSPLPPGPRPGRGTRHAPAPGPLPPGLGTLYAGPASVEQARTALSTAIDLYRDMDMTFWLPQTEAALAQVEGQ